MLLSLVKHTYHLGRHSSKTVYWAKSLPLLNPVNPMSKCSRGSRAPPLIPSGSPDSIIAFKFDEDSNELGFAFAQIFKSAKTASLFNFLQARIPILRWIVRLPLVPFYFT